MILGLFELYIRDLPVEAHRIGPTLETPATRTMGTFRWLRSPTLSCSPS